MSQKATDRANPGPQQPAGNTLSTLSADEKLPGKMRVIDTTATHESGPRIHEVEINGRKNSYSFTAGTPVDLDQVTAARFLRHDHFQLVDENGAVLAYKRPPRQLEDLGAGEQLKLAEDETIARFDELTSAALLKRVLAMPGGEAFAKNPDRTAIINHIVGTKAKIAKVNSAPPEDGPDTFIPDADDEAA